jgi:UPF0716 protein FxsA
MCNSPSYKQADQTNWLAAHETTRLSPMRLPIIGILFLLLPILEIAGIILVGNALGLWTTLALILGSSVLGVFLLRMNAVALTHKLRKAATLNQMPEGDMLAGNMRSLGSVLLIFPGFICKILGVAFMLPPFQKLLWSLIGRRISVFRAGSARGFQTSNRPSAGPSVVDLDDSDFQRHSNSQSPWYDDPNKDGQKRID